MSESQYPPGENPNKEKLPPGVELRPHVFDGIEEYDQRLPNWWLATFYGAMVIFVVWWGGFYQFGMGQTDLEKIEAHQRMVAAKQAAELESLFATDPDGTLWKMSQNQVSIDSGKAIFETKCVACHAKNLSAMDDSGNKLPGLPLNDAEWKYGGSPLLPTNIFKIVKEGSPDKTSGMQSWVADIGPKGVADVVAYVLSHHQAPAAAAAPAAAPP